MDVNLHHPYDIQRLHILSKKPATPWRTRLEDLVHVEPDVIICQRLVELLPTKKKKKKSLWCLWCALGIYGRHWGYVPVIEDRTRRWLSFWHRRHSTGLSIFLHHIHTHVQENNGYAKKGGLHNRFHSVKKRTWLLPWSLCCWHVQRPRQASWTENNVFFFNITPTKPTISVTRASWVHLVETPTSYKNYGTNVNCVQGSHTVSNTTAKSTDSQVSNETNSACEQSATQLTQVSFVLMFGHTQNGYLIMMWNKEE